MSMQTERKEALRTEAYAQRSCVRDVEQLSESVYTRLMALPEYRVAQRLSIYVGTAEEVQTLPVIRSAWASGKSTAVPCCIGGELRLFWIQSIDELRPRTLGILEPSADIRTDPARTAMIEELDLVIVPGLAFDRRCGRLGHGKGYYDRFLSKVSPAVPVVALAFECQLFPEIPMSDCDMFVDKVLTENAVYEREDEGSRLADNGPVGPR